MTFLVQWFSMEWRIGIFLANSATWYIVFGSSWWCSIGRSGTWRRWSSAEFIELRRNMQKSPQIKYTQVGSCVWSRRRYSCDYFEWCCAWHQVLETQKVHTFDHALEGITSQVPVDAGNLKKMQYLCFFICSSSSTMNSETVLEEWHFQLLTHAMDRWYARFRKAKR